jgi:LmbE family N-acetylglucosaminyl deacetylase
MPVLLCVHPHPDDESIACGGVLARAAAEGVRTVVVTCTAGEEGENLAGIDLGDVPLVEHRRRELAEAIAILGVARTTCSATATRGWRAPTRTSIRTASTGGPR